MADITNLFKAQVKALKLRNKSIAETKTDDVPTNILAKKHESAFESKAKNLVKTITKLRDFLLENRKSYVNSGSLLSAQGSGMSESERDQIDNDAQEIIKSCRDTIVVFRVETDKQKVHPQVKEHRHAVMILVDSYLKAICKVYSEQKAVRVKRVVDRKRISKLEPERKYNHLSRQQLKKNLNIDQDSTEKENVDPSENSGSEIAPVQERRKQQPAPLFDEAPSYNEEEEISPEEAQLFEQENKALYEEMNSMAEEVKHIEGQVVEIAKLQEIFTEKILEQDVQMNQISTTVVGTTENIKDANEEIREAIKKKAEFRVWILFFLVVCSLSLLFLDWYNN
ncbi:syntaxin-18 [Aplysia californica]|uniref:Syntaxin-18 n=1 Tax=Aplysia californica TaxID=6500 RepID=A0ABM0JUZ9_APLCA|nr:syntaxin-18 [Aplysia californica]